MIGLCLVCSVVHISPSKVWRPDIMVYNSVEHYDYETTDLILVNTGEVGPGRISFEFGLCIYRYRVELVNETLLKIYSMP